MEFEGQVILVTGAGRGIGKAIASAFAREKARVVLNDLCSQDELDKVAAELSEFEGQCMAIRADVSRSDQVREMIARIERTFQRLDILVNNAGIIRRGTIETVTEEEWDLVLQVNLKGTFNCCKAVVDIMKRQQRGKMINVSSVAGKIGDITSAPGYGSSKAAIDALTKTLARQLAQYNINVNAVAPHAIATEMSAQWSEKKRQAIIAAIPLQRLGTPEDVAAAVLFLASEKANFITGEILDVNGGFVMD
ncbi:3-oxoacyl-[acyl-carrier-protein] reductase [Candidatus Vecturithrix granuli]|uniref:3-oxoacyl-[acyl-carrier-protein] reductase n=1 Tax=Vecturithrix granuli TaxID=1499967 RepID=A0A081BZ08_VECG1|nr:3-oxoacyl-[acyl-carrier-protein] reductase [Candidatus Vecturithrix granuli]